MQKSIESFFKSTEPSEQNSSKDSVICSVDSHGPPVNNVNNKETVQNVNKFNHFRPGKSFQFPKSTFGKRGRRCQQQWFEDFKWLHYDTEKDSVLCFYCHIHHPKLTAEHNKDPVFITTGFKNWKKAPMCFKDHEKSKCHIAALTYETVVPSCRDPKEMISDEIVKKREKECQYLTIIMECLHYLARQGIAFRGNNDIDSNFAELILLRSKEHPWMRERITSGVDSTKKYTHNEYQDELLNIMASQVLRKKLYDINNSKMFSVMCDEYTDISNKQQLSFCLRWVDEALNSHEDFLGFYKIPNIRSDTIVSAMKDAFTRFNLPFSDLRGQTYDGASNMLGKKSGVAVQIKLFQPKAVESHCQGHSLSLSVKDTTKASRLLGNVMGTVAEITTLVKYSPKREQLLGSVKENIEIEHGDNDVLDQIESLSKLCATHWTVRATTMRKVMTNYQPLFDLWDLCLEENLDRETRSRIVGCQSKMTTFRFFYGLNLWYTVYSLTDNLSKTLQSQNMSAIEGKSIAMRTVETLDSMRNETASDLFF